MGGVFTYGDTPTPTYTIATGSVDVTGHRRSRARRPTTRASGSTSTATRPAPTASTPARYTGVQFDISGSLTGTGCTIQFSINDSEHADSTVLNSADPTAERSEGRGPEGRVRAAAVDHWRADRRPPTTIKVPFTDRPPTGGSPATPLDPTKLEGVQWQLTIAGCRPTAARPSATWNINIANVKFYTRPHVSLTIRPGRSTRSAGPFSLGRDRAKYALFSSSSVRLAVTGGAERHLKATDTKTTRRSSRTDELWEPAEGRQIADPRDRRRDAAQDGRGPEGQGGRRQRRRADPDRRAREGRVGRGVDPRRALDSARVSRAADRGSGSREVVGDRPLLRGRDAVGAGGARARRARLHQRQVAGRRVLGLEAGRAALRSAVS